MPSREKIVVNYFGIAERHASQALGLVWKTFKTTKLSQVEPANPIV